MSQRPVVISAPLRTAIGTFGGSLKETTAVELGRLAVRAVLRHGPSLTMPRSRRWSWAM